MGAESDSQSKTQESWDLIVDSAQRHSSSGFRQALGYTDLIFLLAKRDLTTVYKQTFLGPLWLIIQPLIKVAVFYFIFGRLAGISTEGVPAILFYLIGLTFWEFFASIVRKSAKSFIGSQHIFSKVYFPRLVVPFSTVVSSGIRSGIQAILLIFVYGYYVLTGAVQPSLWLLLLPVLVVVIAALGLGLGLILASFTVVFRDLQFVIDTGLQILFYLTPVIYPLTLATGKTGNLLLFNPLASVLEAIKLGFVSRGIPDVNFLVYSFCTAVLVLFIGLRAFRQKEQTFIDTI